MSEITNAGDSVPRRESPEETPTITEGVAESSSGCGRVSNGHPSDRVRAAFALAIESLKADMGADGANETEIASSLKSKIREILNEEISKKQQASSVFTAASALTSLCDMSDHSTDENEEAIKDRKDESEDSEAKEEKKTSSSNRDDIPMSFPQKLMEILDDKNNDHIITWLPHGKAFIIYQKKKFGTEILTKYFKESKYTSFTRKLNRWGFVRVTKGPEIGAYYHKCFQQKNYLLCMQMSCQSTNKVGPCNDRVPQGQAESAPMVAPMFSQGSMAPLSMPQMALQSQAAGMHAGLGAGQMQSPHPHQMDLLSQQIQFMNLQRQANSAGVMPGGGPHYSSAVVGAAVDALQRSYEANQNSCGGQKQKAVLGLSHAMQQHIERYQRAGIMHPGLYAAIMQQQAAAGAMVRAQRLRQEQHIKEDNARKQRRSVAKRAHAA